jgi:hypothetical protein
MHLERRFEKGSGLAIELPGEDGLLSTVLARVVALQPQSPGWLLEVKFVSELSEEEVSYALRHASRQAQPETADQAPLVVSGVLFTARLPNRGMLRWFVRKLDIPGAWPIPAGKVMCLNIAGLKSPLKLRVRRCHLYGSCWTVACDLAEMPTEDEMAVLNGPNVLP